jgi:hypothetical protein
MLKLSATTHSKKDNLFPFSKSCEVILIAAKKFILPQLTADVSHKIKCEFVFYLFT